MVPLTVGFLAAGPLAGHLADKYGARPFATGGLLLVALTFILLQMLPVNFGYPVFATLLFFNSVGMGLFIAPNQTGIMNSLPANQRGAGAGMAATFNSSAQVLSIGIFFTLMILGLSATLPSTLFHGLVAQGVSPSTATRVSHLPPVGSLFAAFLGLQPDGHVAGAERPAPHDRGAGQLHHRPVVLPASHLGPVREGSRRRPSTSRPSCACSAPWRRCCGAASTTTARATSTPAPPSPPSRRWPRPSPCWWAEPVARGTDVKGAAERGRRRRRRSYWTAAPEAGLRISDAAARAGRVAPDPAVLRRAGAAQPVGLHRRW